MSKKAKAYKAFPGQHDHEEVLLVFRHHLMSLRRQLIVGMLLIAVGLLPVIAFPASNLSIQGMLVIWVIAILYSSWAWVGWYYSVYIATNERIIEVKQHGFFDRRVTEFGLDKVQNINYHIKGLQAVLFRYGTIAVRTYVGDLVMKGIHNPVGIQDKLVRIVQEHGGSTGQAA